MLKLPSSIPDSKSLNMTILTINLAHNINDLTPVCRHYMSEKEKKKRKEKRKTEDSKEKKLAKEHSNERIKPYSFLLARVTLSKASTWRCTEWISYRGVSMPILYRCYNKLES